MTWGEFKRSAPDLATLGEERFERTGLVLVGSIRKDGWPRISPVEPMILDGVLLLGMMWQSTKARDLLRDSRCTVHSTVWDRDGSSEGQFRVHGLRTRRWTQDSGGAMPTRCLRRYNGGRRSRSTTCSRLTWKARHLRWYETGR